MLRAKTLESLEHLYNIGISLDWRLLWHIEGKHNEVVATVNLEKEAFTPEVNRREKWQSADVGGWLQNRIWT